VRRTKIQALLGLATVATLIAAAGAPANAGSDPDTGLTFYRGTKAVANFQHPQDQCTEFPSTADFLVGWSDVQDVLAYKNPDCSGPITALGTLRGFPAGIYQSFRAF